MIDDLYRTAYLFYEKGHFDEAIDAFSTLTILDASSSRNWFGLAATWQLKKEYTKALDAWSIAAILDPENPYPYFHAAECLLSKEDQSDALKALELAKEKDAAGELNEKIETLQAIWKKNTRCV